MDLEPCLPEELPEYIGTPDATGEAMTVCIAAIAKQGTHDEPLLVTVSDLLISNAHSSSDRSTVKQEPFHQDWSALLAGSNITQCVPIIELAKKYFQGRENTLQVARSSFKRAYQNYVAELAADTVLGRYGLDMKTFLKSGKRMFPESKFMDLSARIDQVRGQCEFLIYGYDKQKKAHLFTVKDPGIDSVYDKPGYVAIGAGKWAAEGLLSFLNQNVDRSLRETIVNVCCAKFMAERVPGVGRSTFLFVKRFGFPLYGYAGMDIEREIRAAWEKDGCPRVPSDILKRLDDVAITFTKRGLAESENM